MNRHILQQVLTGLWWGSLLYSAIVVVPAFAYTPESLDHGAMSWYGQCPAAALGSRCIACGLTHSVAAIGHGEVARSWNYHHAGIPLFAIAALNIFLGFPYLLINHSPFKKQTRENLLWV